MYKRLWNSSIHIFSCLYPKECFNRRLNHNGWNHYCWLWPLPAVGLSKKKQQVWKNVNEDGCLISNILVARRSRISQNQWLIWWLVHSVEVRSAVPLLEALGYIYWRENPTQIEAVFAKGNAAIRQTATSSYSHKVKAYSEFLNVYFSATTWWHIPMRQSVTKLNAT